jgi:ubiquinone/menaquinone biosynthesis C-methylase UbiE
MDELNEYYNKRATEYEQIYYRDDPDRQIELAKIKNVVRNSFKNKSVLEIACGTGYWTETAVKTATNITAVDYSGEMLKTAKAKKIKANFMIEDAYSLQNINEYFNAGLANFWFSHIPKRKIKSFLNTFHNKLQPLSVIIMADNIYDKNIGGELNKKENDENTYKIRDLKDGTRYQIVKNYYSEDELDTIFQKYSSEIKIHFGKFYWWIKYILN